MLNFMGIYDIVFSQFDLGTGFWNRELRTQDLDGYLSQYYIDPKGHIWSIDYSGTYELEDAECIKVAKSQNHGRVSPFCITKQLELYPAKWGVHYAPTPRCMVTFEEGIVTKSYYS